MPDVSASSSIFNGLGDIKRQLEARREREMVVDHTNQAPELSFRDKPRPSAQPTRQTLQRRYHRIFSQRAVLISLVDRLSEELYAVGSQLAAAERM
jgi:hypothetical protein